MAKKPAWQEFEHHTQRLLALDSTIASGNKFYDPGDGVNNQRIDQHPFPMIIDCKYTMNASMSLKVLLLTEWQQRAGEMGKRFVMPIRFDSRAVGSPQDYALLGLDDFAELLGMAT